MYTEAHKAIREDPNKEDPEKDTSKTKEEWKASPHPIPPSHNISTKILKLTSPPQEEGKKIRKQKLTKDEKDQRIKEKASLPPPPSPPFLCCQNRNAS